MGKRKRRVVTGYAQMWPREVFHIVEKNRLLKEVLDALEKPGVYVLYIDDVPHYIGKATRRLADRLFNHSKQPGDKYYNFWNFFSAFEVPKPYIDQIEAVLIAAMPTANSASPRIRPIKIPTKAKKALAKRRQIKI